MPNLVQDKLFSPTGDTAETWQNDADSADQNRPQPSDTMGVLSPTGLASELRAMKSVTKGFALDPVWVNYTGDDVAAPSPNPPQYNDPSSFTLDNGPSPGFEDWTSIALLGRVVRGTFDDGTRQVAVVVTAVVIAGNKTLVTLNAPILGTNTPSLVYVSFSSLNPIENPFWLNFDTAQALTPPHDFVVPVNQGGTGQTTAVAGGDLSGTYPNPTVVALQGNPINAGVPTTTSALIGVSGGRWAPTNLISFLNIGQLAANAGYFRIPTNTGVNLIFQWGHTTTPDLTSRQGNADFTWPITFTNTCFVVWAFMNEDLAGFPQVFLSSTNFNVNGARIAFAVPNSAPIPTTGTLVYVFGIGF